jgi:hypothetical protein
MLDALDTFTFDGIFGILGASIGVVRMSSREFTLGLLQGLTLSDNYIGCALRAG